MSVKGACLPSGCRHDTACGVPKVCSILWMGDKVVETRELPVADGHPLHVENERILRSQVDTCIN